MDNNIIWESPNGDARIVDNRETFDPETLATMNEFTIEVGGQKAGGLEWHDLSGLIEDIDSFFGWSGWVRPEKGGDHA